MTADGLRPTKALARVGFETLPSLFTGSESAARRFVEFFTANIRNRNTRDAYARAVKQFADWLDERGVHDLGRVSPVVVAAYIEYLGEQLSKPSVKQHLAAIRMLLDYLVIGGVLPFNPASSVRGPKHSAKRGKTPVLSEAEARQLLDSIPLVLEDGTLDIVGLRDRALIGLMTYTFARVSAAVAMRVEDYYGQGKKWWFRLHEKGGKRIEVPAHHNAETYIDAYLDASGLREQKRSPLFRSAPRRSRNLSDRPMTRNDVLRMVYRRAKAAELTTAATCHTFRATGITAFLNNGGELDDAQKIAGHESPRTTQLYDRTSDELTLDQIERIAI